MIKPSSSKISFIISPLGLIIFDFPAKVKVSLFILEISLPDQLAAKTKTPFSKALDLLARFQT